MCDQIRLKNGTELTGASYRENYPLAVEYADGRNDRLWLFGQEFGPEIVIVADSFETAWEAAIDALPTIPGSEIPEAYGFDSEEDLDAAIWNGEEPELIEGYEYQANASGTGIVAVSDYAWLQPLTKRLLKEWQIKLEITADL